MLDLFIMLAVLSLFLIVSCSFIFSLVFYLILSKRLERLDKDTTQSIDFYGEYLDKKIQRCESRLTSKLSRDLENIKLERNTLDEPTISEITKTEEKTEGQISSDVDTSKDSN